MAEFIARVVAEFRENILGVIALSEDHEIYGSDMLIIARSKDPETLSKILGVEKRDGEKLWIESRDKPFCI